MKEFVVVDHLSETGTFFNVSGMRQRPPGAAPEEMHHMQADLMLGTGLASEVYGRAE